MKWAAGSPPLCPQVDSALRERAGALEQSSELCKPTLSGEKMLLLSLGALRAFCFQKDYKQPER